MKNLFTLSSFSFCLLFFFITELHASPAFKINDNIKLYQSKSKEYTNTLSRFTRQPTMKSTLVAPVKLEKVSYDDGSYKLFEYNNDGLMTDYKNYTYDDWDQTTTLMEHQEITYDNNDNQTLFIDYYQDTFDGFVIQGKIETSYFSNGIPNEIIQWYYNSDIKELVRDIKEVYTLENDTAMYYSYTWDMSAENWILTTKGKIFYTDYDHPDGMEMYTLNEETGEFDYAGLIEVTYNNNGDEVETITSLVDEETGEMTEYLRTTTEYNSNRQVLKVSNYLNVYGTPMLLSEDSYSYENGLLTNHTNSNASFITGVTEETSGENYNYVNGILSEEIVLIQDTDTGHLIENIKYQFTYNQGLSSDDVFIPYSLDKYYNHYNEFTDVFYFQFGCLSSAKVSLWDYSSEEFTENYEATFHYSNEDITSIDAVNESNKLQIGPNPFTDYLVLNRDDSRTHTVIIYNTLGKVVMSKTTSTNMISTTGLENGLYIVQVKSDNDTGERIKMVKK